MQTPYGTTRAAGPAPTYAEMVYERLRNEILDGMLRPGDRLAEIEIAQRMGTSQGPVREALARLRANGLVISFAHRGSYVSDISIDEARDVYGVRAVLERHALKLALARMGPGEFATLVRDAAAMEEAAAGDRLADNLARDMLFHRRIYEWSGSALLLQFWEAIEVKIRKFAVVATPPVFADPLRPVRHHYKLIDEMRNGYSAALEAVLDEHLALIWMTADELDERAGDARPG